MILRWLFVCCLLGAVKGIPTESQAQALPPQTTGQTVANTDTTRADSLAADSIQITVEPKVGIVNLQVLGMGFEQLDSLTWQFEDVHYWDEIDTIGGFVQSLGQIGKPYRQFLDGLPASALYSTHWVNPITGQPNVYMYDPVTQLHAYDTRTPFVDAEFKQSSNFFQLFKARISQNVRPWWNTTLLIRRRRADGLYDDNLTRHWNFGFTNYFRTLNRRYLGIVSLGFNELNDQMNGGVIQDGTEAFDDLFAGIGANLELGGAPAVFYRRYQSAYTQHTFYIVNDSVFKIGPTGSLRYDAFYHEFDHGNARSVGFINRPSFPYARINPVRPDCIDCNEIYEEAQHNQWTASGGGVATLNIWGAEWHNRFLINVNTQTIESRVMDISSQNRNAITARSDINIPIRDFRLNAFFDLETGTSNRFDPYVRLRTGGQLDFFRREFKLIDSTYIDTLTRIERLLAWRPFVYEGSYVPFNVRFELETADQNPTLFDRYWNGATFTGDQTLGNQSVFLTKAEAQFTGEPGVHKGLPYLQNQYRLGFSLGRLGRPWYYTEDFTVAQVPQGEGVVYTGLHGSIRQRIWRFYIENQTTYLLQSATSGGPEELVGYLPELYGTARMSYRSRVFRKAADISVGLEAHYRTEYDGYQYALATQAFYPLGGFDPTTYVRIDAFLTARITKAMLFFRLVHLNEGFWQAGYWTTPFYPMLNRAFSFGVRWRFYD